MMMGMDMNDVFKYGQMSYKSTWLSEAINTMEFYFVLRIYKMKQKWQPSFISVKLPSEFWFLKPQDQKLVPHIGL